MGKLFQSGDRTVDVSTDTWCFVNAGSVVKKSKCLERTEVIMKYQDLEVNMETNYHYNIGKDFIFFMQSQNMHKKFFLTDLDFFNHRLNIS